MRDLDARPGHDDAAGQDQVDVERARRLRERTLAPCLPLDGQEVPQELDRCRRGAADRGGVQVGRLPAATLGLGFEEGRDDERVEHGAQAAGRERKVGRAVTEVAAEGDRDSPGLAGGFRGWAQRVAVCFCLHSMQTRVHGMAFSRAGAIGSPQSRQIP